MLTDAEPAHRPATARSSRSRPTTRSSRRTWPRTRLRRRSSTSTTTIVGADRQPPASAPRPAPLDRASRTRPASRSLGDIIADSQLAATAPRLRRRGGRVHEPGRHPRPTSTPGDITYGEAFAVQPFGNSLVTMTLTGAQIDRALEQQWDGQGTEPKVLGSRTGSPTPGTRAAPLGPRVDAASIKLNGVPIDPAASYRVTVNSFLADGGDGFTILKSAPTAWAGPSTSTRLRVPDLTAHDPIAPTPRDRITRVNRASDRKVGGHNPPGARPPLHAVRRRGARRDASPRTPRAGRPVGHPADDGGRGRLVGAGVAAASAPVLRARRGGHLARRVSRGPHGARDRAHGRRRGGHCGRGHHRAGARRQHARAHARRGPVDGGGAAASASARSSSTRPRSRGSSSWPRCSRARAPRRRGSSTR